MDGSLGAAIVAGVAALVTAAEFVRRLWATNRDLTDRVRELERWREKWSTLPTEFSDSVGLVRHLDSVADEVRDLHALVRAHDEWERQVKDNERRPA